MECAVLSERMVLCHVSVWGYGMCGTEREYGQVVLNASRVLAKLSLTKVPYPPTGCIRDVRYCRRLCCDPSLSSYAMSGTMYRTLHHCYHDSKLTSYVNMTPIHRAHTRIIHQECLEDLASSPSMLRQLTLVLSLRTNPDAADAGLHPPTRFSCKVIQKACYALSGTDSCVMLCDVRYRRSVRCYAMPGTDAVYGAISAGTRALRTRKRDRGLRAGSCLRASCAMPGTGIGHFATVLCEPGTSLAHFATVLRDVQYFPYNTLHTVPRPTHPPRPPTDTAPTSPPPT
eukprot:2790173-Rhodomonas_salina.1